MRSLLVVTIALLILGCMTPPAARDESTGDRPSSVDNPDWLDSAVFYEIFVRSFADADGDGNGDIQGIIDRLDYLESLGITALWLMPVHPSTSYHGYDVTDYYDVHPDYGTVDDLRRLVSEAQVRGIRTILDLVINHTSIEHPWFVAAASGDPAWRDWYQWAEEIRGPGWHRHDGEAYYGHFWSGMPDLNVANPAVVAEIESIMEYWIAEVGVHGFRIDAAKHLVDARGEREHTPETFDLLSALADSMDTVSSEAVLVGEVWDASVVASKYVNAGVDLVFSFDRSSGTLTSVGRGRSDEFLYAIERDLELLGPRGYATFLTNHDQDRVVDQLGHDRRKARLAAAVLLSSPGVPFIYYGEEIGMRGSKPDPDIRTPMQWRASPAAGFTDGTAWREPQGDFEEVNVAAQDGRAGSLLEWYRDLVAARTALPSLSADAETVIIDVPETEAIVLIRRDSGDRGVVVVLNFSQDVSAAVVVDAPSSPLRRGNRTLVPVVGTASLAELTVRRNGAVFGSLGVIAPGGAVIYRVE